MKDLKRNQLTNLAPNQGKEIPVTAHDYKTNEEIGSYTSLKQCATALLRNPQKAKNLTRHLNSVGGKTWSKVKECYFYIKLKTKV